MAGPRAGKKKNMLVAAIISVSTGAVIVLAVLAIVLIILFIRSRSAPRRRRRQTETAARLFDDSAISAWSNNDSEEWSDKQREAALIYYNTAGRRARIGGIRADLIPDNHRGHIQRLTESIGDDDASRARWSDLLWLNARVEKQSSPLRSATPPETPDDSKARDSKAHDSKTHDSEAHGPDSTEVKDLATALGLNGSTIDMDDIEQAAEQTAPLAAAESSTDGDSGDAQDNPNGESSPDAEHRPDHDASISTDNPGTGSKDQDADTDDGDSSQLPDVPAWILEARAALPKSQSATERGVTPTRIGDSADAKPTLAGTDFPWPHKAASAEQVTTVPEDMPEPIDFIPDVDIGQLATTDDNQTAKSEPEPAGAGAERSVEDGGAERQVETSQPTYVQNAPGNEATDADVASGTNTGSANVDVRRSADERVETPEASTDGDIEEAAILDEIRRLKHKAKKAGAKSEQSSRLTVKYAREGRRKRARVAANAAFDHAELAKRLRKRARRLERSLKD